MSDSDYSGRQPAKRVLATELNAAHTKFKDGDGERDPSFLVLPSGGGANRVTMTGVVTETEDVGSDNTYMRMNVVDMNGDVFRVYAGEYQPEARGTIESLEAPERVTVIGKPRTYQEDEDSDVLVSLRPEAVSVISTDERNRISLETAQHTLGRLQGERGSERFQDMADAMYADSHRSVVSEAVIETLEEIDENVEEAEEDDGTLTRDELEQMDYTELSSLAGQTDIISGNAPGEAIIDALAGEAVEA